MIVRRRVFDPRPREEFWAAIEACAHSPGSADESANAVYLTLASLVVYRGTWRGRLIEEAAVLFERLVSAIGALLPLPTRVVLRDGSVRRRVAWLCWVFVWGVPDAPVPGRTWLPGEPLQALVPEQDPEA